MRIVALFVALPAAFALYAIAFGTDPPIWIFGHRISGPFESALVIAVCSAALFGIYRRVKVIWWIGWIVLAAMWLNVLLTLLSPEEWRDATPLWFFVLGHFVVLTLVGYFTYRWYQQKVYFTRVDTHLV